jgi:hypothetical protein
MVGVSLVAFALFASGGIVAAVLLLRSRRLLTGGFSLGERRRMRREGTPAHARVLDAVPCNLGFPRDDRTSDNRVALEIYDDDGTPIDRVQLSLRWRSASLLRDESELLAFFDFPSEHWRWHARTFVGGRSAAELEQQLADCRN